MRTSMLRHLPHKERHADDVVSLPQHSAEKVALFSRFQPKQNAKVLLLIQHISAAVLHGEIGSVGHRVIKTTPAFHLTKRLAAVEEDAYLPHLEATSRPSACHKSCELQIGASGAP